ncbi:hypothetical protein PENTCL1PPCAC_29322, partial [Pristionchus entomophagus]
MMNSRFEGRHKCKGRDSINQCKDGNSMDRSDVPLVQLRVHVQEQKDGSEDGDKLGDSRAEEPVEEETAPGGRLGDLRSERMCLRQVRCPWSGIMIGGLSQDPTRIVVRHCTRVCSISAIPVHQILRLLVQESTHGCTSSVSRTTAQGMNW